MRVLVTGAGGMLGRDLCAALTAAGHAVTRADINASEQAATITIDLTDTPAAHRMVYEAGPDVVIHAAAWTDVDGCEADPDRAYRQNALATWNLAAYCASTDTPILYMSTDFVFDGMQREPYTEHDATAPLNHYGRSKLAGEQYVRSLCRRYYIVRTAWLYGRHGRNFPARILELARSRPEISVVTDQVGSPTCTTDLSSALVKLITNPLYGTYHITNGGSCSWYELAQTVLSAQTEVVCSVSPIPASQYPSVTRRPAYSVLRNMALEMQGAPQLRPWQDAVREFVSTHLVPDSPV